MILFLALFLFPPLPFGQHPLGGGPDGLLGAHQQAQMAADAFFPIQHGPSPRIQAKSLVAAVHTGKHAPAAADLRGFPSSALVHFVLSCRLYHLSSVNVHKNPACLMDSTKNVILPS